jgi:ClpP class serine protease
VVLEVSVDAPDKGGARRYEIVSRNAPNKRPDLSTDEGRAKVQVLVNSLADVFVAKVSRNLGVKADRVVSMGDSGGIRVGAAAVRAGLAKRLGSLESVVKELATGRPSSPPASATKSPAPAKTLPASAARLEVVDPTADRARVAGIMALSSPGLEAVVLSAINDGCTVEEAGCRLFQAMQAHELSLRSAQTVIRTPSGRPAAFSTAAIWKARRGFFSE